MNEFPQPPRCGASSWRAKTKAVFGPGGFNQCVLYVDGHTQHRDEFGNVTHAMRWTINEAVHEALEWLQVDGIPVLFPHDLRVEEQIMSLCDQMADDLIGLANQIKRGDQ